MSPTRVLLPRFPLVLISLTYLAKMGSGPKNLREVKVDYECWGKGKVEPLNQKSFIRRENG